MRPASLHCLSLERIPYWAFIVEHILHQIVPPRSGSRGTMHSRSTTIEVALAERDDPLVPTRVLLLHPDPRRTGGVSGFVESLFEHLDETVRAERFVVGRRRNGWGAWLGPLVVLTDLVRLAVALRRVRYDVIHVNPSLNGPSLWRDGAFLLLTRWFSATPVCVFLHGWDRATEERLAISRWRRMLFARSFGRAGRIFVLAQAFRERLIAFGCAPDAVTVISTMFNGNDVGHAERARSRVRTLLFMSRLVPEKGAWEALDALRLLRDRGHELRLLVAGSGPERARLERYAASTGLAGHVTFTGFVRGAEKARLLDAADLFVLPTRHGEGCPVAVLEAMAAGLPIVTTAVGGIPDVVEHRRHGWMLRNADPAELAGALEHLMAHPALVTRMSRANRKLAWARYEASVVTGRIVDAYRSL